MLSKIKLPTVELQDCALIKVGDRTAIIDKDDLERIGRYEWHLRITRYNTYAVRWKNWGKKQFRIPMHRQIMHCPRNAIVHHKNHNGLDNRKANLENMNPELHHEIHRFQ